MREDEKSDRHTEFKEDYSVKKEFYSDDPDQPLIIPDHTKKASEEFSIELARMASDSNCFDVQVLDISKNSPVAQYFIIATGTSCQQIRSVAAEIATAGKHGDFPVFGKDGFQQGRWAVVDFVDIVVHLFDEEYREFYNLEMLWGDAKHIEWQRPEDKEE